MTIRPSSLRLPLILFPDSHPVSLLKMLANVALPAFFPHSFATLIGIFVIAAIEGWFLSRILRLEFAESYKHSLFANLRSTIVGIPLAWLLWVVGLIPVTIGLSAIGTEYHPAVQSATLQSAFSGGFMPDEWTNIGAAASWLVLLIPFWFGSVWIERRTLRKRLPDCDSPSLSKAVVRGNLASYSIFLVFGIIGFSNALVDLPNQKTRFEESRERQRQFRAKRAAEEPPESGDQPELELRPQK